MQIDKKRLTKYLDEIVSETMDLEMLLARPDDEILPDQHLMKSLKYSTIVIAEAIAASLQHILAKRHNAGISGTSISLKVDNVGNEGTLHHGIVRRIEGTGCEGLSRFMRELLAGQLSDFIAADSNEPKLRLSY
ncbi:MAG: hypothetical protein U5R49_08335 [Deltaproteobacteria bacterium]|nr:hypothetical protein [Deltaproteobacteria bacterium]